MRHKQHIPASSIAAHQHETPFFLLDTDLVVETYYKYHKLFPGVDIYYAMKSNSEPSVLKSLKEVNCGFEIASMYELELLEKLHVQPNRIIYGTAVKPLQHIAAAHAYGVDRFAADSLVELEKIAHVAPGARVFVRAIVDDTGSVFTMSEKFGTPKEEVIPLLLEARRLGLKPYGVSFNVGSQAGNPLAWAGAIDSLTSILKELLDFDIKIEILNLGGGFPYQYQPDRGIPSLEEIAVNVAAACQNLPYLPQLVIEPGRGLVAHSSVLVASVFSRVTRRGQEWLYLDAGTYNALFEAMAHQGSTPYRVTLEGARSNETTQPMVLAGPTGDGLDVIMRDIPVPSRVQIGDRIVIHDVGAYTFCMAGPFNGFPIPKIYPVDVPVKKRLLLPFIKH
jgi:ornithine decarboxylase